MGARQPQGLRHPRGEAHRELHDRRDAVGLPDVGVAGELRDLLHGVVVHVLRGLRHVDGDELCDDALGDQRSTPRGWAVDEHNPHSKLFGLFVDEALPLVAGREEDYRGATQQLAAEALAVLPASREQPAGNPRHPLAREAGLQLPDHAVDEVPHLALAVLHCLAFRQAARRREELLGPEVAAGADALAALGRRGRRGRPLPGVQPPRGHLDLAESPPAPGRVGGGVGDGLRLLHVHAEHDRAESTRAPALGRRVAVVLDARADAVRIATFPPRGPAGRGARRWRSPAPDARSSPRRHLVQCRVISHAADRRRVHVTAWSSQPRVAPIAARRALTHGCSATYL
mmetsp:Transcript_77562/g.203632  ORF Transcript_77562/g.203632 Transcript_77562/m.203632 type:complete len:343 (-) Transcript_77562:129-1157(-)